MFDKSIGQKILFYSDIYSMLHLAKTCKIMYINFKSAIYEITKNLKKINTKTKINDKKIIINAFKFNNKFIGKYEEVIHVKNKNPKKIKCHYSDGLLHGSYEKYLYLYGNYEIIKKCNYFNNILHGLYMKTHVNIINDEFGVEESTLRYECNYEMGRLKGLLKMYYNNNITCIGEYNDNVRVNDWMYFSRNRRSGKYFISEKYTFSGDHTISYPSRQSSFIQHENNIIIRDSYLVNITFFYDNGSIYSNIITIDDVTNIEFKFGVDAKLSSTYIYINDADRMDKYPVYSTLSHESPSVPYFTISPTPIISLVQQYLYPTNNIPPLYLIKPKL